MKQMFEKIKKVALLPSIHPNEKPVKDYVKNELEKFDKEINVDKFGNIYIISDSNILLSSHMDKQAPPYYQDIGDKIEGKLDDAIGVGIMLTLAEKYEFKAIFTVGEEDDLNGSYFALKNGLIPHAEKCIVIDTSPLGNPGGGPIFYTSFDYTYPSQEYLDEVFNAAKSVDVTLQPMEGPINDGVNLIKAIQNTIALEPHIEDFHTSHEISLKKDVIDTYKVIEQILETN